MLHRGQSVDVLLPSFDHFFGASVFLSIFFIVVGDLEKFGAICSQGAAYVPNIFEVIQNSEFPRNFGINLRGRYIDVFFFRFINLQNPMI